MSEHQEHREHYEHAKRCDSCCGDLFMCGDLIRVAFVTDPGTFILGTYISSSCNRLIWRRNDTGELECTPCELITIQKANTGTA